MVGVVECMRGKHLMPAGRTDDDDDISGCRECLIEDWFKVEAEKNPEVKDLESYRAGWYAKMEFEKSKRDMQELYRKERSLRNRIRRWLCLDRDYIKGS